MAVAVPLVDNVWTYVQEDTRENQRNWNRLQPAIHECLKAFQKLGTPAPVPNNFCAFLIARVNKEDTALL